jgi:hypothetical protein
MEELCLIPTRCSALQNVEASNNLQVVIHKSKQKHVERKPVHMDQLKYDKVEKREMDMKKVRYEVFRFGMSGFKAEKKEEVKGENLFSVRQFFTECFGFYDFSSNFPKK